MSIDAHGRPRFARRHTVPPKTEARYRWAIFTPQESRWPAYTATATVEREEFARGCSCLFFVSTRTGTRAHAARGDTRAPRVVRPVSAIFGFGNSPVNYRDAEIRGERSSEREEVKKAIAEENAVLP